MWWQISNPRDWLDRFLVLGSEFRWIARVIQPLVHFPHKLFFSVTKQSGTVSEIGRNRYAIVLFVWLFFGAIRLTFKVAWGLAKIVAILLFIISLPTLVGYLLAASGVILLIPLALVALAFGILKACLWNLSIILWLFLIEVWLSVYIGICPFCCTFQVI